MNLRNFFKVFLGLGADVVTVTTGTAGNAGNVSADLITYLAARLLEVAELNTITDQFGGFRRTKFFTQYLGKLNGTEFCVAS